MLNPKKILFVDDDNFQTEARAQLLTDTRKHQVDIADSISDVKTLYQRDRYDIVIIDFACDFSLTSLQYIENIDPLQNIIMISENEEYSKPGGCDHCVTHHHRRRLTPPFPFLELVGFIENYEFTICEFKNKF